MSDQEMCPFHRVQDGCLRTARMLSDAGLLDPVPDAPATIAPAPALPAIPATAGSVAAIVGYVNAWGRAVVDPTIPYLESSSDLRSVRFTVQALKECASARSSELMLTMQPGSVEWHHIGDALGDAEHAAKYLSGAAEGDV